VGPSALQREDRQDRDGRRGRLEQQHEKGGAERTREPTDGEDDHDCELRREQKLEDPREGVLVTRRSRVHADDRDVRDDQGQGGSRQQQRREPCGTLQELSDRDRAISLPVSEKDFAI